MSSCSNTLLLGRHFFWEDLTILMLGLSSPASAQDGAVESEQTLHPSSSPTVEPAILTFNSCFHIGPHLPQWTGSRKEEEGGGEIERSPPKRAFLWACHCYPGFLALEAHGASAFKAREASIRRWCSLHVCSCCPGPFGFECTCHKCIKKRGDPGTVRRRRMHSLRPLLQEQRLRRAPLHAAAVGT